ncbi:hypothetical protein STEG23_008061, partial [Scotinomys teguina]
MAEFTAAVGSSSEKLLANHFGGSGKSPKHTNVEQESKQRARTWKQPRCPSTEEWIRKMWYIYTMEYYAAEKNNDIMKFAGKWMELENVILSEILFGDGQEGGTMRGRGGVKSQAADGKRCQPAMKTRCRNYR